MLTPLPAAVMDCPQPPVQTNKDWDPQVRTEVVEIGLQLDVGPER